MNLDRERSQATVYFTRGLVEIFSERHLAFEESGLKFLSEDDEGVMNEPNATTRIAIEVVKIYTAFNIAPPDDMSVHEDLLQARIPNLMANGIIVEALNQESHTRKEKWAWFRMLLDQFIADWFCEREFDLLGFMEQTWHEKYRVYIEYFKPSGKFYAESHFYTKSKSWLNVIDELEFQLENYSPGLLHWDEQFMVYMNSDNHPMAVPIIRQPKQ